MLLMFMVLNALCYGIFMIEYIIQSCHYVVMLGRQRGVRQHS